MKKSYFLRRILVSTSLAMACAVSVFAADKQTMSLNSEVIAVPAPGEVVIDGDTKDWDLSAGVLSYNSPDLVEEYSIWTHLMWDEKGVYYLARIHDLDPLKNATKGVDFARSWQGDAVQLRTIFDDQTENEHQMHMTLYYSTPDQRAYMIVHHGGLRIKPPYDATGMPRDDLKAKYGDTMEALGGKIAVKKWDDGKGYTMEAFMPWSYLRLNGQAMKPGDEFVFGWETLWSRQALPGADPEPGHGHRLADGVKNAQANRIFMFNGRTGWGKAIIGDKGNLAITEAQARLQKEREMAFLDLSTEGSIPIAYDLPGDGKRDVTIAIENDKGERVRNLFGQYPRDEKKVTDYWDGLDDQGKPVAPGHYTAIVVDHKPIKIKLLSNLYNAATPPWSTEAGSQIWGSDHGAATCVTSMGSRVYAGFGGPESGSGLVCYDLEKGMVWSSKNPASDMVATDRYIYTFTFHVWDKKFQVCRLNITDGKIAPFVKGDGEQLNFQTIPLQEAESYEATLRKLDGASLAKSGNSLWLMVPDDFIYKIDPSSGDILEKRATGEFISLRSNATGIFGILKDKTVWELTPDLAKKTKILDAPGLGQPTRFSVSDDSKRVAICDAKTNQVLVYTLGGKDKPVVIGKPKGGTDRAAGPFDRSDVMLPVSATFDAQGRIWVAEGTTTIHRVSVWNPDGAFADEFWGSTAYGATHGYRYEKEATNFIAKGIEFKLDYDIDLANRKSAEVPLFYHPHLAQTQGIIYRVKDAKGKAHEFAVSTPGQNGQRSTLIFRKTDQGEFVPAVGLFPPIDAQIRKRPIPMSDQLPDSKVSTGWMDKNANGRIEAEELIPDIAYSFLYWSTGWIDPQMTILTCDMNQYPMKGIDDNGVPIYDFKDPRPVSNPIPVNFKSSNGGTPLIDRAGNISDGLNYHMKDGRRGSYPNRFRRHDAPAAQRGLIIAPFRTNGVVEDVPGVGSITAVQGDRGEWFLMSIDGLFLSSIFQDIKGRVKMDENLIGGESFGGHLWRVTEGPLKDKVMLQSGNVSYRFYELINLDTIRRQTLPLNVTEDEIKRGEEIAKAARKEEKAEDPIILQKVAALPVSAPSPGLAKDEPLVEGATFTFVEEPGNPARWFKFSAVLTGQELALIWQVADDTPWKNGSDTFTHAFAGGDAVDFHLLSPSKGPLRILAAKVHEKPEVILFQKKAATPENPQKYMVANAPGNARTFDIVKILKNAKLDVKTSGAGYTALVRLPLSDVGLDADKLPTRLLGLAGVIFSDRAGTNRTARLYWHDKNTSMVNDIPTESDVEPKRLGEMQVK